MSEYINKVELIEHYPEFDGYTFADVSTIDIVTCKDCKRHRKDGYCRIVLAHTADDWFCKCGERKSDE